MGVSFYYERGDLRHAPRTPPLPPPLRDVTLRGEKNNWRPPTLGGLAPPQTPLLPQGASPPGPPVRSSWYMHVL